MAETSTSPGYYGTEIYSYINELDPTFKDDVSPQEFLERLQDEGYAGKIYAYLADSDETFVEDLSLEDFLGNVKKKEEPAVTESVSDAGSSEQRLASRDLEAERMSAFGAAGGFRVVDSREVPQEGYKSPAEIAKRDSAVTAINTREAEIDAQQRKLRQEEAQRITADLPPVTIPEGAVTSAVSQLQELYGPYGIKFEEDRVPFAMTRAGSKVVKAMAPIGADGKPVEIRLELDEDGSIKQTEAAKLDKLIRDNATYVGETDTSFVEKALKVDQMRPVPRIDSSGVSTVKMASAEVDGKFIAYPTLFPKDPAGTTSTNPNDWMELDFGIEAQDEAFKRGEVFEFDTDEEAKAFADGAWKGVVPMDLEFQKRHREMGRDYDADMAFLDELTERRDEYRFIEDLPVPGARYEKGLIPASYQKYFIDGNMVRDDIEAMRAEKEAELSMLESQFDEDNVLLRLKEDRDVALGERFEQLSTEAAEINADAKTRQNQLQVESIKTFGVRLEELATYEPKTEEEWRAMIGLYDDYSRAASQRQAAALGYERAQTYYDKQYDKGVTEEYVDGWEEVWVALDNGWKRGNAMSKLLLMQMGYYDVIGDEGAEERAMREVSEIMDSQDPRRGRVVSRANMTGTTDSYLASIANNPVMYTAAITAESLGQLAPIWFKVLPVAAVGGAIYGGVTAGPGGGIIGTLGAIGVTAIESAVMIGMPISELALEMGNATLEVGERMGYDWSDPNSALKALNDEKLWSDATQRGLERGIPIAAMGALSNFFMGAAVRRSASLASTGERIARGVGTGLIAEPATEALGEYMAIQTTGEYTGSTANFREIMAEAIGAVGMGASMGVAFGAVGYAKQKLQESNFDLAVKLMDPMSLGAENVSGQRIMNWANNMEKLGQVTPEQAEAIRKNVGRRRQANELLGKKIDSRPGSDSQVIGRIIELLEAKEELERSGPNVFGEKIRAITEEIALIAESGKVEKPGGAAVNLSDIRGRIRNRRPGVYKFNGKKVTREDFLAKLQEATPRQLKRARAYNDIEAQLELISRRGKDAIQKRETTEVPVGERAGFGTEVDGEVREATQEDLQAEEQGTLDLDRKGVILESIAEKLNDEVELNEVEQAFLEDNKEDIEANQERIKILDQASAEVEVRGEPEVEGRIPLKRLKRLAANAKKAMAKNFADANIIIHNDKASYQQAAQENDLTGEGSAGFLATDNKTAHVFAPLASETTIAHETFHVILRNTIDSAQVQELMGEFAATLKKVIPADNPLAAKLDKFQKVYEAGEMNEEYVAEFFGELAAAYPTLDKKGKSVIARFLERLGKLLGVDLKLSPDLTARDQQILSLLERLAGQASRGETVTSRETGQLADLARSTSREQTEENLGAAEQKVSDFTMKEIAGMSDNGVVGHFTNEAFEKFLPKFMKTGVYGAGFYFTGSTIIGKHYGKGPNATIAFVDINDMNLVDRDRVATREELRAAANWLVENDKEFLTDAMPEGTSPQEVAMMNLTSTPYDSISERRAKMNDAPTLGQLHTNLQANFDEFQIEDDMGVITPVFNEVYPEYQGIINKETETGTIVDVVIWDFDAINSNTVKPTKQFAEAAAKGKVSVADFTEIVYEPTVTPEERMAEMEEEMIRMKPETEAALRAAEQRVGDFSDEQIQAMADEGVIFHFGPVDITKVIPEKLKRFGLGYGFYFTNYALEDSVFRGLGERVTMADSKELNLLDGDTAITEEQAKALRNAAKTELQEAEEYGDDLGFEESQVLMSIAETKAGEQWYAYFTSSLDDNRKVESELTDEQKATAARLVQEMLGFDGVTYGSDQSNTGVITSAWNFGKLNRAIIQPGQEPARAAEQRVDIDAVRLRSRAGNRVSKGLSVVMVDGFRNVAEIENLTREYVKEQAPKAYIKNANILAKYPLVRGVREFGDITTVEQADELYDIYTQQTLDNLRWMMETYPDEFSDISTLWYDGANKIAHDMAAQFGATPEQAAGILAALSPQKDWYQNVRLAELLLEAFEDNPVMTREMVNYQRRFTKKKIEDKKKALKKARAKRGTSRAKAVVEKFNKDKARLLNDIAVAEALLEEIAALEGTEMLNAPPYMMPYYVRLHSETTKNPQYQLISPDGEMVGPALKDNGKPAKWAWGSYGEIGKAVSIRLRVGLANITLALGQQHKVRNFFNNIIDPMSTEGDVTMDTHAIAVSLLKPLSTASAEVEHNFGDKGVSNSGAKGIKGTYYANQEAYQILAEEMGLLPRQVQSVTWEAVRGLFTDKFKANKENVKAINQIWENYADGKITIDEARAQVLERAGGVNPPVWAESVQRESGEGVREGRERGAGREGGRAAEQRVDVEAEGPNIVYRSGAVESKAESRGRMDGGRSTGHFGTGAYFFGDRESAEKYDDRDVTAVDISGYNLAPATHSLHDALEYANWKGGRAMFNDQPHTIGADEVRLVEAANKIERYRGGINIKRDDNWRSIPLPDLYDVVFDKYYRMMLPTAEAKRIAAEATRLYNEEGNSDSVSTSIMKALGYDGVYATPGSDMDNSTYGTVIYDVRPKAAEQRVVDPGVVDVLERYEFKPNKSLKNAELAPELNRNLQRFGYGVKQYGTRMNDFRVVSLDTGRAVDPKEIIAAGVEERATQQTEERRMVEMERQLELQQRIIEIYNADERPFTGKDFEARGVEQKVVVEAMAEPGTIADLVARGRELGLRDAAIRSVLLKRFGKDNADAIDTALTEYFDMFRAIPEAFGNVEGGIEAGRQIYDDVRRQLDEFARPKKRGRMTTRERTDRIAELRAKFPEQKNLSDTELMRKHPRQAVAPSIAEVRAEALNLLRNNRSFNEQTTEVQEQLLVAFDKTLQTKANKGVNTLMAEIRNNIRQRRKGAKNARTVQDQLRKLINEVLPRGKYGKRDISRLNKLVNDVNEDNYFDKAEEVLKIVDKQREAIRQSLLTDIENIVKKAAKTGRTPTGKVRARSLDASGQAYFRAALRVLKVVRADDATQAENIKASLSHNPEVDEVTQKYLNGETLTSREQQLLDQKDAFDMFYELNDKSIEELEAIIEDLKITAGFSRANLKATRAARAERMATLRDGAKESVTRDWGDLAVNEDGTAKSQNQIESELRKQKSLGEALKTRGMRAKYDALMKWAQEGKRMAPAKVAKHGGAWSHYGSLTGIMGEFFRENLYKRLGKMEEDYLQGKFKERENLDAMANSIEGVNNGFVEIGEIIFTNGDLTVKYGNTSREFTTDELLRIYALSLSPVQKQRLMLMGFTDEVMADITEFLDDRLIEFADKTVAYLSTDYYEGVNDVHVKVNDVNLPYVENYFPTKTQLEEFVRLLEGEQALRSTFFGPNAQLAAPLKERVAKTSEISVKRDLGFHGELTAHINQMERFKAFAEGTQEMNAVLSDSYTTALANLIGAEKAIVMLASQGVSPERFMSEMRAPLVDSLVSRYTGVSLGYKLIQVVKQASSMFAGIQDYQYGDKKNPIIDRIMWSLDMMRILPGAILEGVSLAKYKGPIQQMMEESATLRSRMEDTLEGDLYGLATGASGTATKLSKKDFQKAQKALKGVRRGGASVTAFGDAMGILGYVPAYQRNRQRGMSKREAIDKFNEYNETQQSRRPGERAPIQIYRDGYRRLLTAFTSSQLLYVNNMLRLTAQINRSVRQGGWGSVSASDLRGLYFNAFGAAFAFAIASNIMLILFGSDDEKEKAWRDSLWSPVKNFFIYPIVGSTAESIYNKLMGNRYPKKIVLDPLDRVERSMTKAVKDGEFGPAIKNTTEMLIGTNLDPAISLIEVAGGEPLEDEIYDIVGVPKSARPE